MTLAAVALYTMGCVTQPPSMSVNDPRSGFVGTSHAVDTVTLGSTMDEMLAVRTVDGSVGNATHDGVTATVLTVSSGSVVGALWNVTSHR